MASGALWPARRAVRKRERAEAAKSPLHHRLKRVDVLLKRGEEAADAVPLVHHLPPHHLPYRGERLPLIRAAQLTLLLGTPTITLLLGTPTILLVRWGGLRARVGGARVGGQLKLIVCQG